MRPSRRSTPDRAVSSTPNRLIVLINFLVLVLRIVCRSGDRCDAGIVWRGEKKLVLEGAPICSSRNAAATPEILLQDDREEAEVYAFNLRNTGLAGAMHVIETSFDHIQQSIGGYVSTVFTNIRLPLNDTSILNCQIAVCC
ncbi:hypothetical protein KC362_g35 [Hortaea werneckii]|nr:hypothetical protein KC362_g35 [Hortaea werneckii]